MEIQEMNNKIKENKQSKIKLYPCNNLRASNVGHPCERYLYLSIKNWEDKKLYTETTQCIFDLGNKIEEYVIQTLKDAGFEVITPTIRAWKVEKPLITGREDLRIKLEDGQFYPVEVKGLSPQEWDKLNSVQDFLNSKKYYVRAYPAQLYIYMYQFGKEKGYFALCNKLTGEIKLIEVPFDYEYAEKILQKAERIYKCLQKNELPSSCDDISVCEYCDLAHVCTANIKRVETDVDTTGELDELIDKKQELAPAYREYSEINDKIKKAVGEREKVLSNKYIFERKIIHKEGYTGSPRDEVRINVKRL